MAHKTLRVGLIGAGGNTRARHIPGLRSMPDVEIAAVCNRRPSSTEAAAREFAIPRKHDRWEDLIADPQIDAVVIGTWPYLHCPITLAALAAGKHVLTEARMSLNAAEAHQMWEASLRHPDLITQIVPSPFGLKGLEVLAELLENGYLGDLREIYVYSQTANLADPAAPLSWRQDAALSGYNMLDLGILHETVQRWVPRPVRVMSQVHAFIPSRIDPESGVHRAVGTPDSVQVLAVLANGVRALYHMSGIATAGHGTGIVFYGSEGVLHYDLKEDHLRGAQGRFGSSKSRGALPEIPIPTERAGAWRVEADFVDSIREGKPVRLTDFETGVAYMEFTEAVARSAQRGECIELPLEEFSED